MKKGLLLINLGTPSHATPTAVWRYLRVFLTDKRVVDLPWLLRYVLVYGIILPFRVKSSTKAYQAIWTTNGSPLLINSQRLAACVQQRLHETHVVALGMRYGEPSLDKALHQLAHCDQITVLPLFPQYASSATGSAIQAVMQQFLHRALWPSLNIIRDFHQHSGFIQAQVACIHPYVANHDHVLLSYHGVPEQHLTKTCCVHLCQEECPSPARHHACYRAQCYATSRLIASTLMLERAQWSVAFQSRLGRTPWIKPYTDDMLVMLAKQGVKRLAIACPSFVVDCLETLEEIGIRANEQWRELGGEVCTLIPCLNDHPMFVEAIAALVEEGQPT